MRLLVGYLGLLCVLLTMVGPAAIAAEKYPFQDPDRPIEERIDNILSLMTRDEKIACLGRSPSVPRLGIVGCGHVEGLHGLAMGGPSNWGRNSPITTTQFPQAIGMAETWDPEVIRQAGAVEGYEARYVFQNEHYYGDFRGRRVKKGGLVVRAPNADLGRDIRWGRNEECYGEDPYLCGTLAAAMSHGLQGDDPKYWQTASLMKHFLANSNENGREHTSSDFDERLLQEYYSVPFRMGCLDGGSNCFMASYNAYNGVPCTVQPILRDVALKQWGLRGIICTDANAFRQTVTDHKYYPDLKTAVAGTIKAGISQFLDRYDEPLREALDDGSLTEQDLDDVLRRNFWVMIRLGLLDPPEQVPFNHIGRDGETEPWNSPKHQSVARLVAQKSIVLLKNDGKLLPIDKTKVKSIAVIGPSAAEVFLDWYSGTPPYAVSPLDGIRDKVGPGVHVTYAADNTNEVAATAARLADVAIVCVGNHPTCNAEWGKCPCESDGKEGIDRRSITLEQEELVKAVYAANKNTIVVLVSSFPFAINWTQENVPAIVHLAHNCQETGHALADVLFGDVNPAGRLVQTWRRSIDDLPPMLDYDIRHGRTYMYFRGEPLYPFGYGLSYTTFDYSNLRTSADTVAADGRLTVSVDLKNTGERAGEEVVEMYVKHVDSTVDRPQRELKGFQRVSLAAGETKTVELPLSATMLAYWDVNAGHFTVEADKIDILIGRSAADIALTKTIDVKPDPSASESAK
ncbi:MAG TPA: glycoside hydrolase family 3 C-terminal domain-containing protein [Lacipirellulaceae bacterium]|jgi:beta-glucosidase